MKGLIVLVAAGIIFVVGVLVGIRGQEINLREREHRLAQHRRRVNDQLRALDAYQEANSLIWHAHDELRQAALLQAHDVPVVIDLAHDPRHEGGPWMTTRTARE